jgi:hypothetical protein
MVEKEIENTSDKKESDNLLMNKAEIKIVF